MSAESKICGYCQSVFFKQKKKSPYNWVRQRYCSTSCGSLNRGVKTPEDFERCYMPEPNTGCWLWVGRTKGQGKNCRPVICKNNKWVTASRFSYQLHIGVDPADYFVCHKCDTPMCVNPSHFFLGTRLDNIEDMRRKGRANKPRGNRNPHAVLTPERVIKIRTDSRSASVIGKEYGVSKGAVLNIKKRNTWFWLNDDGTENRNSVDPRQLKRYGAEVSP